MRQFIILTGIDGSKVSVDINDIVTMHSKKSNYCGKNGYTIVEYKQNGKVWNVKESVEEIVKRINEINNNNNK